MFAENNDYLHINSTGTDYPGGFSNTIVPQGGHTLTFAQRGGKSNSNSKKVDKRKIKNISNMYKMTARKLKHYKKSLKRKLTSKHHGNYSRMLNKSKKRSRFSRHKRSIHRNKHMKGGSTVSYAVGGVDLSANNSALAERYISVNNENNSGSYNHFTRANI